MDIMVILLRTLFFFFFISFVIRFLGKREVGQLGIFDFVVVLIIADIAVIAIENLDMDMMLSVYAILLLSIAQKIISFILMKIPILRNVFDGKPSIIVYKGKMIIKEMKKQSFTVDDLLSQIRISGIRKIDDIELAILETNGQLSVFKYEDDLMPLPVIASGMIVKDNLEYLNKSEEDIKKLVGKRNIKDIYCAFLKDNHLVYSKFE